MRSFGKALFGLLFFDYEGNRAICLMENGKWKRVFSLKASAIEKLQESIEQARRNHQALIDMCQERVEWCKEANKLLSPTTTDE